MQRRVGARFSSTGGLQQPLMLFLVKSVLAGTEPGDRVACSPAGQQHLALPTQLRQPVIASGWSQSTPG